MTSKLGTRVGPVDLHRHQLPLRARVSPDRDTCGVGRDGAGGPIVFQLRVYWLKQRSAAKDLAQTYTWLLDEAALRNVAFRMVYNWTVPHG